jgi:hypothetical protein
MGMGRHPLAGIAAAFAGVSGGFGANFLPTGLDPMIAAFTEPAAQIIDPSIHCKPTVKLLPDGSISSPYRYSRNMGYRKDTGTQAW